MKRASQIWIASVGDPACKIKEFIREEWKEGEVNWETVNTTNLMAFHFQITSWQLQDPICFSLSSWWGNLMGYLPGFVRRASLTLRLGSCLASFREAQMANVLKKVIFLLLVSFPWDFPSSPLFLSFFLAFCTYRLSSAQRKVKHFPGKRPHFQIYLLYFNRLCLRFLSSLCSDEYRTYLWYYLKFVLL